jgi:hypothetical protein
MDIVTLNPSDETEAIQLINNVYNEQRKKMTQEQDEQQVSSSPEKSSPMPKMPSSLSPGSSPHRNDTTPFAFMSTFQNMLRDGIQEIERVKLDFQKKQMDKDVEIEGLKTKLHRVSGHSCNHFF